MRIIIREDVPCWYELSFAEKIPAIILRVHEDFVMAKEKKMSMIGKTLIPYVWQG